MHRILTFIVTCSLGLLIFGETVAADTVPTDANDICPILVGETLPELGLRTADDEAFDMAAALAKAPVVLIVFRGGWCPFCNTHLGQVQTIQSDLLELGFQILAVSADRAGIVEAPVEKEDLGYHILSDSDAEAAQALGIAFRLEQTLVDKYKNEYGIDVEADSGATHHILPVPSAFVIDQQGVVQFSYINPNYKVRIEPALLLEAARSVVER